MINVSKIEIGALLADMLPELFSISRGAPVSAEQKLEKGYSIKSRKGGVFAIRYAEKSDLMMALGDIIAGDLPAAGSNTAPFIESRGLMLDCSRNAVPTADYLKRAIIRLALMGMNRFCLYTEDTYEVEGEPLFGYARGRYSKKEIRELANFAESVGVTMFPCIQTLGHLEQVLKYRHYESLRDTERVLNALEEKTYVFLEKIIREAVEPYNSKIIHLGMDETWGIGRGNSFRENTPVRPLEIYAKHVAKVAEICEKSGLKPIMWGDFVIGMSGEKEMSEEERSFLPPNVTMNYWNYSILDKEEYKGTIAKYRKYGYEPMLSPGMHNWGRFWTNLSTMKSTTKSFLDAAYESEIRNVMMTMWGDDGHENLFDANGLGLSYFFSLCRHRNPSDKFWKKRAEKISATPCQTFSEIAEMELRTLPGLREGAFRPDTKMIFYDDPLNGTIVSLFTGDESAEIFMDYAEKFKLASKKLQGKSIRDLLKFASLYSQIVSLKISIGVSLRKAYSQNDRKEMKKQIKRIPELSSKLSKAHSIYRKLWLAERKPFGLEVMDSRFATMICRVQALRSSVRDYLKCKTLSIPEFEVSFPEGIHRDDINSYRKLSTRCLSLW